MKSEEKQKLLSTLKDARDSINNMVEASGMVSKTFISMMNIPKEYIEKKESETETMEKVIDDIDECLKFLEKSD